MPSCPNIELNSELALQELNSLLFPVYWSAPRKTTTNIIMGPETLARGRLLPDFSGTNTRGDSGVTHLAAKPGGKDYGTLTLWVGHRYVVDIERIVQPGAFEPPPKVDSAVVLMRAREKPLVEVSDEEGYFKLIRAAFAMRRKTLLNNLRTYVPPDGESPDWKKILDSAGVDSGCHVETLIAEDFSSIFRSLPI